MPRPRRARLADMAARLSRSDRVVVEEAGTTRVVGRVERTPRGWLALTAEGQRIYGPKGPVFSSREEAADVVAAVGRSLK